MVTREVTGDIDEEGSGSENCCGSTPDKAKVTRKPSAPLFDVTAKSQFCHANHEKRVAGRVIYYNYSGGHLLISVKAFNYHAVPQHYEFRFIDGHG